MLEGSERTVKGVRGMPAAGRRGDVALGVALLLLGAGAAAVSLLGPLVLGIIRYHASAEAVNQVVGGDVAGLVLVAPAALVAGVLVLGGSLAGRVLALGPAAYALYMYSQLTLGGDFARYPGNSERFFLLFVGLFVLAAFVLLRSWNTVAVDRLPATGRRLGRLVGWFALLVAGFLVLGLHLPGLVDAWRAAPASPERLADPEVFWLVKFMDLGIVVPVLLAVGIGLLRRQAWAGKAVFGAVGWMALMGSSVAGMAVAMQVAGDPQAAWVNVVAFCSFAVIGICLAVVTFLPLFRMPGQQGGTGEKPSRESAGSFRQA